MWQCEVLLLITIRPTTHRDTGKGRLAHFSLPPLARVSMGRAWHPCEVCAPEHRRGAPSNTRAVANHGASVDEPCAAAGDSAAQHVVATLRGAAARACPIRTSSFGSASLCASATDSVLDGWKGGKKSSDAGKCGLIWSPPLPERHGALPAGAQARRCSCFEVDRRGAKRGPSYTLCGLKGPSGPCTHAQGASQLRREGMR